MNARRSGPLCGWTLAAALIAAAPAAAHPHVMVTARSALVMDAGKVTGVRHSWIFDEAYSAYATMGFPKEKDGSFARRELDDLARLNVESMGEFKYFTSLKQGRTELEFAAPPPGYRLEHNGKALVLHFLLPLKTPVVADSSIALRVDDESFFVAFSFAEDNPVMIEGNPGSCKLEMKKPQKSLGSADLSRLSEDMFANLKSGFTDQFATTIRLACAK
ncbi:MAG TPA: DUF1007 family protein [Beijerinckiaceae bacterium]|nr:DUF1007 family protein [Beijerinckiaceae bacterium]